MPNGISNFQIEETIKKLNDDDLSSNFVCVFPSDEKHIKTDYKQIINQKTGKYPFFVSNTEDSTKNDKH